MNSTRCLKDGMYPAMVTLYTKNGEVDYRAASALTAWYAQQGCSGVFAACLSSEIFQLTQKEKLGLVETVLESAPAGMEVVASGHTAQTVDEQIAQLKEMARTGVKTLVLITNRLAAPDDRDEVLKVNISRILEAIPDVDFGLYEGPTPYNRLLTPEILNWCAQTDRFVFLKDTCCCLEQISRKIDAVKGTRLKIYNANSATLLDSVKAGAAGISGVMGNFHPGLYERMLHLAVTDMAAAERLQELLGFASVIQYQMYPINAKYYLQLVGLPVQSLNCRSRPGGLSEAMMREIEQMYRLFSRIESDGAVF